MKKLTVLLCCSIISLFVTSQIIQIPQDYSTISEGFDAAASGDTILVDHGTYVENLNIYGKSITIGSLFLTTGDTSHISQTIIDGNQNGPVVIFAPDQTYDSKFVGFTLTNGSGENGFGGGIFMNESTIILSHLIISGNTANNGGGIFCRDLAVLNLSNSFINNNVATQRGGGIESYNSSLNIENCEISNNEVIDGQGGAIYYRVTNESEVMPSVNIESSIFAGNFSSVSGRAGGTYFQKSNDLPPINILINDCYFADNYSNVNTALEIRGQQTFFEIINCTFESNEAVEYCAGAAFNNYCSGRVINCLFDSNAAATGGSDWNSGGVSLWSGAEVDFLNCTFVNNTATYGGGLATGAGSEALLINCIFWNNEDDQIAILDWNDNGSTVIARYNDIQGGQDAISIDPLSTLQWGEGNIETDPLFLGGGDYPYSLDVTSPCIDVGLTDTVGFNFPSYDMIGNERFWDGDGDDIAIIDMGPYEFGSIPVGIEDPFYSEAPSIYINIYPNPMSASTTIEYYLDQSSKVDLHIYNQLGEQVEVIKQLYSSGKQQIVWDAQDLPSGMYYVCIRAEDYITSTKVLLLR